MFLLALALSAVAPPVICSAIWHDAARNRDVPVRITLPAGTGPVPVVLWSPGLGGDVGGGSVWASAWSTAGLAVVQMQHAGSDGAVYRAGGTPEERQARIVAGSSPEQLLARVGDARFVLTALGERPRESACDLTRIATDRAAIAGHSMGAWVAQAVAGQRFDSQRLPGQRTDSQRLPGQRTDSQRLPGQRTDSQPLLIDRRVRAAVAFSPTGDPEAATGAAAFGAVAIPFLSITGSFDGVPPSANPAQRAAALAARSAPHRFMPADSQKCLLVFGDASHMMFSGNPLPGDSGTTAHHVQAVSGRAAAAFLKSALAGARPNLTDAIRPLLLSSDSLDCK